MSMFNYLTNQIMIPFLQFSYNSIAPNYGIAIILLTIIIKIAFYPLTKKQFQAMKVSQALQPKVKEIQAKYKNDPKQLQQEMMRLWKENNANPLGGCLPMLIQIPFFLAIFWTIQSEAFKQILSQPGINTGLLPFWLADLRIPDHTFILPALIAFATYWSQKQMTMDPMQARIFMIMPVIMFFVSINFPSGVLLYWATSQIISTVQQHLVMRQPAKGEVEIILPEKKTKKNKQ